MMKVVKAVKAVKAAVAPLDEQAVSRLKLAYRC